MATTKSPSVTHEIEIKLDADSDFVRPDLAGLPGVASVRGAQVHELSAVYLDTEDLRLDRHRTTLRRRTGGADEGWHLKLPDAGRGRVEVRRPLEGEEPPADLLDLVRVQLRGTPVTPVARITTRRTLVELLDADGAVLAEVADDDVRAESTSITGEALTVDSWRELEVELVNGDRRLLEAASALLVDAGARLSASPSKVARALRERRAGLDRPTPAALADAAAEHRRTAKHGSAKDLRKLRKRAAGDVVVEYLGTQVHALVGEDPRVRLDGEDSVHQMRVATRRLRTVLASYRPLFTRRAGEPLRAELKWLAGLLGAARDAEVIHAALSAAVERQPTELVIGPVRRRLDLELRREYREAHEKVVEALDGDRYLRLVEALEAFVARPPLSAAGREPAKREVRDRVRKSCLRVERAAAAAEAAREAGDQTVFDTHLHEVRIAAKRARYSAEVARPVAGPRAKSLADAMEAIQETLGDHQDAVVERRWLRDLGIRAFLAGENGFTFGRLHGLADARAQHDEARFEQIWADARKVVAAWPG